MDRLFGPRKVNPVGLLVVLVGWAAFGLHVGFDIVQALVWAGSATLLMSMMASWGLGGCRFGQEPDPRSRLLARTSLVQDGHGDDE